MGDRYRSGSASRSGNSPGQVYLVDFGSVQTATHDGTVTVVGTYGYMPPEQFGGRSLPASDLFSLGATLIYLATGQHPADLPQDDLRIEFEKFTSLSKPFSLWIRRLIEPSLSKRAASVEEAIDCLQQPQKLQQNPRFSPMQPPNSKIQLEATATRLDLQIPRKQIQTTLSTSTHPTAGSILSFIFVLCVISRLLIVIFNLMFPLPLLGFFLLLLGAASSIWLIVKLFSPKQVAQTQIAIYRVRFELGEHSIFVSLFPNAATDLLLTAPQKLRSISLGSTYTENTYRLNIGCQTADGRRQIHYIYGDRAEIQWLCDEISEWGNLKIGHVYPA